MKFLAGDLDGRHLFITDLLLCRIYPFIQCSFDFQSRLGCRGAYEIDHRFPAQQGASPPIVGNLSKETVVDLVPFIPVSVSSHAHRTRARIFIPKASMRWWRILLAGSLSKEKARQACHGAVGRPARILNGRILLNVKKRHPAASGMGGLCPAKAPAREKAANSSCEAAVRATFPAETRNLPEGSGSFCKKCSMTGRHQLLK